jgi:hypothetical protein
MNYALLSHESQEHFNRRKEPGFMDAWAAGIFTTGSGLQPPETATLASVRHGKRNVHDEP